MALISFMEGQESTIQICSVVLITFLLLLIKTRGLKSKKLPPGPPGLPIIGNMNQLMGPSPQRSLTELAQKHGPIMHLMLGSVSTIIISSAELAKEIMKTHDLAFASRPKIVSAKYLGYDYTDIAFAPYGPYWRQLRKICILELLSNKRVESYRFVREEEVSHLIRSLASASPSPVNLAEKLFTMNHDITSRITFSQKFSDGHGFRAAMKEGILLSAGFNIADFFPSLEFISTISGMRSRINRNFVDLDRILNQIIDEHIENNRVKEPENEDLVDVLLKVQKDDGYLEMPVTKDNIKAVILDLFVGGTENASNTVEWAMTELIRNPKVMEKAQEEVRRVVGGKATVEESDVPKLSYIKAVVKETLRLHTPLPLLIPRESIEKCTINGYEIPIKTRAIINYWAISRDPLQWKDPEVFDPERFTDGLIDFRGQNYEFVPFGAGRRVCPGIMFGVANMELPLAALLYHFDWKLPNGMKPKDLDMNETFGLTLCKKYNLCLVPTLRFPV